MAFLWTCPFCDRGATIGDRDTKIFETQLTIETSQGYRTLGGRFIVCPNPRCRQFTLDLAMYDLVHENNRWTAGDQALQRWSLIPPSKAKRFPDYIPKQILQDYLEACLIVDASPKASATLSRRCLQGMIRDFWKITNKPNLKQEIDELQSRVDAEMWKAIDAIRKVGKIGAHMEKDVDSIVDIEAHEAEKLIGLIEVLLKEWYMARREREEQLKELAQIGVEKDEKSKAK